MNSTIFLRAVFDSVGLMAASSSARMIGIGQEYINDRYSGSLARAWTSGVHMVEDTSADGEKGGMCCCHQRATSNSQRAGHKKNGGQ
jgi:hypothetical protein